MPSEAQKRVSLYLEAKDGKKKSGKKAGGKLKTAAKKNANGFHDKLDGKLQKLAKKHGVKISMRRNKKKLPVILVGGLKKKPYGEVVGLFKEISNTSPVPQKMVESGASFRVFGPRAISASDEGTVFNVETFMEMIAADTYLRNKVKKLLAEGEDDSSSEDTSSNDDGNSDDSGDDEGYDDDEGYSEEDEANKSAIVNYITSRGISRDAVNTIVDKAAAGYIQELKEGELSDAVGFIYDMLGPDDSKAQFKALGNKMGTQAKTEDKSDGVQGTE